MARELDHLDAALERVRSERSMVRCERVQFEEFREAVRLVPASSTPGTTDSNQTPNLIETYRETVMSTPDFEETYGGSIEESLEQEFSPTIEAALLSDDSFSRRLKRKLLVQCSQAIERRQKLEAELQAEACSVETARGELLTIRSELAALPDCTIHRGTMDSLFETWEAYERLASRCERMLDDRQKQFTMISQSHPLENAAHSFNEYLYGDLETVHPVLVAIASTLELIAAARGGASPGPPTSDGN